ncbi:VanZ family protein [Haliea sp. E1-2-M8]|uniref:VanZ family protein n=1 Tax=Haliea sp. E1-2-M8 TaxID=3064706 RepID=UPI0027194180|nr:VanZ family protein [Haliea sp. E1-2-M8]MDO8862368.1 VanZ family protein [Haliea sp. E1-2-M8]
MPRLRYRIISVFTLLATLLALLLSGEHLAMLAGWWPWRDGASAASYSNQDKLVHAGMFAISGYFVVLGWVSRNIQAIPLYLGLLALGGCTEWLQGNIPGRGADNWDLVADAAGAAVGVTLGLCSLRRNPPG